jgi:hypothetical protein
MGALVDVTSEGFLLPRKQFAGTLRALEAFEKAEDLEEALEALSFRFVKNEKGDLVDLSYGSDKAPSDAGELWPLPLLEALAPFVKQGTVVVYYDGDAHETVYTFGRKKIRARTRKHEPKQVANEAKSQATESKWITAPEDSFGLEWRLHMKAEHEWYRKRERLGSLIDALAKTKAWQELEELYFKHERVSVKSMSAADVKPYIANGRWLPRWLASADRQATLEIDVATFDLGLRLRLRDAALARVGQAAVDEIAEVLASWARAHGGEGKVLAHVGAFGPGYAPRTTFVDPNVQPARDLSFRADALVTIVTRLEEEKEEDPDEDLAVLVTRRMGREHRQQIRRVAAAQGPLGGSRTDEGDLVVVKLPCKVEDRASISAAADAHTAWIAPHVRTFGPVPLAKSDHAPQEKLRAEAPRIADCELSAWVDFSIDDDPYWFRDRALFEVVYRAIAKTSWWVEVVKSGTVEAALQEIVTGRNDKEARLSRGDHAKIVLAPNVNALTMRFTTKRPKKPMLHDLVAIISDVRNALRGRGQLEECAIRAGSTDIVDVVDPCVAEDGRNGHRLHAARLIAAAEPPPGVERVERDGLVAWLFTV